MTDAFAEVAVAGFSKKPDQLLTYKIPSGFINQIQVGSAVKVPLRQRKAYGWVLRLTKTSARPGLKDIEQVVSPGPLLTDSQLDLAQWLAGEYLAFYAGCLEVFFSTTWLKRPKQLALYQNKIGKSIGADDPAAAGLTVTLIQYGSEDKAFGRIKDLAGETRSKGKQVLILAPAINQADRLFKLVDRPHSGKNRIWHSGLPVRRKMAVYFDLLSSSGSDLVCGTRQALFLPWQNLGLIIIHREHDDSYKQPANPHYETREAARYLAQKLRIPLVLTSPAPSCAIYQAALDNQARRVYLTTGHKTSVKLIAPEKREDKYLEPLRDRLGGSLASGGRAIFYLNRRGWAPVVYCPVCRKNLRCPNCSVNLAYEAQTGRCLCHRCGHAAETPLACPGCGQTKLRFLGWGTERLTQLLQKSYPGVPVLRLDSDTAKNQKMIDKINRQFSGSQPAILVATSLAGQIMIRPAVDLLVLAEADQILNQADFQSAERLWRVIKELMADWRPESCLIMTGQPQHHLFQALVNGRDEDFYEKELELRRQTGYPPSAVLSSVIVSGKDPERVAARAKHLAEKWRQQVRPMSDRKSGLAVLGPVEAPIARIKGQSRWQILLKGRTREAVYPLLEPVIFGRPESGVKIELEG